MTTTQSREAIETRLSDLRRQRGAAALDGRKFDAGAIAAAEAELEALDDAAAERVRRARLDADRVRAEQATKLRTELVAAREDYLNGYSDAEESIRNFVEAVQRIEDAAIRIRKSSHGLTGDSVPLPFSPSSVESRLGTRAGSVCGTISGHRSRLGGLEWRGTSLYRPDQNWREAEAALVAKHINPLLLSEKSNGSNGKG
jgi:hypothetical protein